MNYHTNIRHQELVALLGSRNLYLRLVYAHIDNYTKVKGAWCGSQRDLAAQLELPIATVSNQITELVTKGLIVREANMYRSRDEQVCSAGEQKRSVDEQKRSSGEQNQPPIIENNNMERNEEIARAQIRTAQAPTPDSFEELIKAFTLRVGNFRLADSMRDECLRMWTSEKYPEWKKKMLIARVTDGTWSKPRLDWLIGDFDPKPYDYNRHELPKDVVLKRARFNGKYGIFSAAEALEFGMEDVKDFEIRD